LEPTSFLADGTITSTNWHGITYSHSHFLGGEIYGLNVAPSVLIAPTALAGL
ncbi:MAG: hypothetical protein HRU15_10740, partial [Planctomycetes bacterium]|nr:hypothetical protein [Planctomycetota bacterium]